MRLCYLVASGLLIAACQSATAPRPTCIHRGDTLALIIRNHADTTWLIADHDSPKDCGR